MSRLTREQSQALTRARILEAAGDVVARYGYDGASVDRIADAAGYSKGAFYSNFASKEDVLNQLLAGYVGTAAGDLSRALEKADSPTATIDAVARWSDERDAELKWGVLAIEFLRRARSDGSLSERERAPFISQWHDVGRVLIVKLFPGHQPPIDPIDLGGIVMTLTYGGISGFLQSNTAGQMVRTVLNGLTRAYSPQESPLTR